MPSERAGPHPSTRRVRPYYYRICAVNRSPCVLGGATKIHEVHPWQIDSLS
jgi:hypothetical protein